MKTDISVGKIKAKGGLMLLIAKDHGPEVKGLP